jgi:hypothetical protein
VQWIHQRQTRRSLRRAIIATAALACALTATTAANAAGSCTPNAGNTHMVCLYTAAGTDSFTVPAGVRRVWITAVGGGGGGAGMADSLGQPGWTSLGGNGATVTVGGAPVLPGGTLSIYVGAGGVNGTRTSGGGGGGATKVSGYNSMTSLLGTLLQTDIAIIAGGGGGAGGVAFGGGQGGHGGAFANGKGGDGAIAGYLGRCAGGGGGGATAAGGTGILDNGDTINSCLAGATVTNNNASGGNGGSSQDGGTGGLGADAMLGAGGSGGRACSFLCPNADNWAGGGGGGGGWGGGGGGYFGAGGGAGGSKVASTISLDGVTTAYSTDAGNGGVGSTNTPSESGWVRIAYPLLSQAITIDPPSALWRVGTPFTIPVSSTGSDNPVTFARANRFSPACSVSDNVITFIHGYNECQVLASKEGTLDYLHAETFYPTGGSRLVHPGLQTIVYTSSAAGAKVDDTYTPVATGGGSGKPVTFALHLRTDDSYPCSIDGSGRVTFTHVGTCTIRASQAGTDAPYENDYWAASNVNQVITVDKADQAIAFTSTAPAPVYGDASTYTPIASGGNSGNARTFTIDASASGVCSISAGIVTFQHAGTCTINANQAGTDDYNPAPQTQQTLTVSKADQAVAFTTSAPGPVYGDSSTYAPAASDGGSGNARVFTIDASASSVCSISAGIVTFQHAGTCTINANQTGSSDYNPAPQTQQSITVDKANQATSFTSSLADPRVDGTYTPIASGGGSGNARTFTIDASASGVCTISAGIVTFQHVGTCTINANQTGTSDYYAAPQSQQTLTVDKADQTIAFTSTAPTPVYGDASQYTPAASGGNSGNARTFTIDASSSSVCTISAGIVTFQHAGTCLVNANQTGSSDYNAAPQTQQSITVNRAPQAISFTSTVPDPTFGDIAGYTPTATGGASGNSVVIAVSSDAGDTCAIDGTGHVSFQHGGICTITATQAGTANYLAAPPVTQAVRILPAAQTVAIASAAPTGTIAGGDAYTPTTTGSDRGTAIVVAATGACVLRDGRIAPVSPGTCRVTATRPASRDFAAAEATQTYDVGAPPVTTSTTVAAVPNAAGSATVAGVQVAWPAKAFAGPVTVGVTTSPAAASFAAGTTPIRLQVTDAAGKPVTSFREPLEIVFAPGSGTPGYSRDGRTWTAIPRITGPRLPNGYADGWFAAADGSIHVLTTHATDFGILAKGAKIAPALRLTAVSTKRQGAKLMVRVATSLPARIQVRLQGASATAVRTSSTSLTLRIPAQCATKACTLVVRATAGGETAARTVRVR